MSRLAIAAVLAIAALAIPAHAQRVVSLHVRTAGDLATYCTTNLRQPGADAKVNYCHGFAQAVVDLTLMHGRPFCIPAGTKRDGTLVEFARWVGGDATRGSVNAATGLTRFLAERYPCH